MGKLRQRKREEAETEFEKHINRLIENGIGFSAVRLNDDGEHVLRPFNEDKEYKFNGRGHLMNS